MNRDNQGGHPYTNALIHTSSPYLLQHAHNPVNWYPWNKEALDRAKAENKPLIISIGYAACHWCHVMEHESFSDTGVADYMNAHFISIKVDREERPDIDQIYMNASTLLTGSGGWPLNAFALPGGRPFYVLTYLPKIQWLELLHEIVRLYDGRQEELEAQAEAITKGVRGKEWIKKPKDSSRQTMVTIYQQLWAKVNPAIDWVRGGFTGAPKFPMPGAWELLLQHHYFTGHEQVLEAVNTTLKQMAWGGIYDQLGGGFARYATDAHWHIPHFEKMLYDNGQLISLYCHAYQLTGDPLYAGVIDNTLAFILREMTDETGGFYSSLNADSEGEEGRFYVWTADQMDHLLGEKMASVIKSYYHVTADGNWEDGKNILYRSMTDQAFAEQQGLSLDQWHASLHQANELLLNDRNTRARPSTDTKILASWNGLMMKAFLDAYRTLGNQIYLDTARRTAKFLEEAMMEKGGRLWRNYMLGKASITGLLDDYAFVCDAFICLYETTFDLHWLKRAEELARYALAHFYDKASGLFFYTPDHSESLIARKQEMEDNVLPSSNSVMAHVLYRLGVFLDEDNYRKIAAEMLAQVMELIPTAVPYFSNWAQLLGLINGTYEVVIMGREALNKCSEMQKAYLPAAVFMGGQKESLPLMEGKLLQGETLIYVCQNKVCQLPVEDTATALKQMKRNSPA